MRRRAPVPLAAAVEKLAAQLEPVTPLAAVQRAWNEAEVQDGVAEVELAATQHQQHHCRGQRNQLARTDESASSD